MNTAILRFTPAWTHRACDEPRLVREFMVHREALKPVKILEPIPVVVDHDMDRQVGTVRELAVRDEVMTGTLVAPWWFAHVEISDPPGWLKRGGGVSWCHNNLWEWTPLGVETTVLRSGLIHEVSILSPSVEPAEPLAQVAWVGEINPTSPCSRTSARAAAGDDFDNYRPPVWDEIERIVGYQVTDENQEQAFLDAARSPLDRLRDEVFGRQNVLVPQVLIRPRIGQVLGVR